MKSDKKWLIIEILLLIIFLIGTTKTGSKIIGNNLLFFGPNTFQGVLDHSSFLMIGGFFVVVILLYFGTISLKKNWNIGTQQHLMIINVIFKIMLKVLYVFYGLFGLMIILTFNLGLSDIQLASFFLFSATLGSIIGNILVNKETKSAGTISAFITVFLLIIINITLIFFGLI